MNQIAVVLTARSIRGIADGVFVVALPLYFTSINLSVTEVGVLSTLFQVGTVVALLWAGRVSRLWGAGVSLMLCSALMLVAALGFLVSRDFTWVAFFALLGAINPMGIDANVFRPLEQGALLQTALPAQHPGLIATHAFLGQLTGAVGALLVSGPAALRDWFGFEVPITGLFVLCALCALPLLVLYRKVAASGAVPAPQPLQAAPSPVKAPHPRRLRTLLALFAIDALGGGFVANALLLVWLHQRFAMPDGILGVLFSAIALSTALAQFLSIPLVRKVGLLWGILLPSVTSSVLIILLALAPNFEIACGLYFLRTVIGVLDVPARSAFVVAHDAPKQFAFSLSSTTLVMSIASALGSLLAAGVFAWSAFAWPLIICGLIRFVYAGLLYTLNTRGKL